MVGKDHLVERTSMEMLRLPSGTKHSPILRPRRPRSNKQSLQRTKLMRLICKIMPPYTDYGFYI